MECTMTGTPVTPDPKRLVSGPCWNLHLRCSIVLNPVYLAVAMMFYVNSSVLTVYFGLLKN